MTTTSGLARSASRSAAVTLLGQSARVLVQFLSVAVLARLLAPQDYGLIAEVLVIIGIGEIVRDFGLTNASVQAKTLTSAERSNLFWLNSAIGVVLGLVVVVASPLVAVVFGDPRLTSLTTVLSVTFLLNGVSTQLRADLNRSLQFGRLTSAEVGGQIFGLVSGVVLALTGAGYWALAGQQLAQAAVTLAILWVMGRFRPSRYRRDVSMRRFIGFGTDVVLAQLLGYASKNTDTVVIGTVLGAGPLGFYNRAFQILGLPLTQINAPSTRVALSVLSRLQDDAPRFRRYLLTGQTVMLQIVLAVFSWSASLAPPLLLLVLGPKWGPSVGLFQILAFAGIFSTAGYTTYWVFVAKGLTRSQLWWQLSSRPVLIGIVLFGSLWGVTGVATAYSSGSALMWLLGLVWIGRVSDAPVRQMFTNALRAIAGFAFPTAAAAMTLPLVAATAPIAQIGIGSVVWAVALALVMLVWPAFRRDSFTAVRVARTLRASRSAAVPVADALAPAS